MVQELERKIKVFLCVEKTENKCIESNREWNIQDKRYQSMVTFSKKAIEDSHIRNAAKNMAREQIEDLFV